MGRGFLWSVAMLGVVGCDGGWGFSTTAVPSTVEHFGHGLYAEANASVYWGRVVRESELTPNSPTGPAECTYLDDAGTFENLRYRLIEIEVQGITRSAPDAGVPPIIGFIELIDDGTTPILDEGGALPYHGFALPNQVSWLERSPMNAEDLPYYPESRRPEVFAHDGGFVVVDDPVVDAGPAAKTCSDYYLDDMIAFGDFDFPVMRSPGTTYSSFGYKVSDTEVCARIREYSSRIGAPTFVTYKTPVSFDDEPSGPFFLLNTYTPVYEDWCWPREEVECLINWSVRPVSNGTDGGTLDGGTSDGGTSDGGTLDGGTAVVNTLDGGTLDGGTAVVSTFDCTAIRAEAATPPRRSSSSDGGDDDAGS